jgi:uncharacterized protein (TIGR02246 family)
VEHWELEARESIRDLVARYNANGDSGRVEVLAGLFAPDGILEVAGVHHVGPDAIAAFLRSLVTPVPAEPGAERAVAARTGFVRHFTATTQIDVESPTRATARSYYQVLTVDGLDHWGRYFDDFTTVDGVWRFAHRRATTDAAVPGGWGDRRTSGESAMERGSTSAS